MTFMNSLNATLNEEFNNSVTENGALGYRTTGKELLDINFSVTSMRNWSDDLIVDKFVKAFYENKKLAVKWLFYVRDAREGVGERRLFRVCSKYLAEQHPQIMKTVIPLVPEYGRWDDLWCLLDTELCNDVIRLVSDQLQKDLVGINFDKPISLLGKWMPSINTSSEETKRLARIMIEKLAFKDERNYRKMLSKLREYLKVVEVSMSKKEWYMIDYSTVPSRANLIYNNAFLRNDNERRRAYLSKLEKGETKINAGVLFPHDIVHKYNRIYRYGSVKAQDDNTLEALWKALPDFVQGAGNTICVADGSDSMRVRVGGTDVSALEVANALAIYFAERCTGEFHNTYITFSERPQIVNLGQGNSLREKIEIALRHSEVANTNIEAVFNLILQTALNNEMSQEDLPRNILILSDMEFDACATSGNGGRWNRKRPDKKLFQEIAERYMAYGYKLPRLVFWNINSRTGTIPVKENDLGVALVSGFSPAIVKMVLSNSTDPFECLLEQLNSERYAPVEKALSNPIS